MKVKRNYDMEDLYCIECKSKIGLDEKFIEVKEDYLGETIIKVYHPDCLCETEEDYE